MTQQKLSACTHPYYRTERKNACWIGKRDIIGWTYWRDVALLTPGRKEKGTDLVNTVDSCKGTEWFCVFLTLYTILQLQTPSSTNFLKQNLVYCWSSRSNHETAEAEFYIFWEYKQDKKKRKKPERTICCRAPLLGGRVSAPTVAFSSFSVAARLLRLLLPTGLIWMWNFFGSSSSKSESLE